MPYTANHTLPYASGSDTSQAAAERAESFFTEQQRKVLADVRAQGFYGSTQKECHARTGIARAALAPRFLELLTAGHLYKSAVDRRDGCAVYKAKVY